MDGNTSPGTDFHPPLFHELGEGRSGRRRLSICNREGSKLDASCCTQFCLCCETELNSFIRLEHEDKDIHPRLLHLGLFVFQPIIAARTRNDGQPDRGTCLNPERIHRAMLVAATNRWVVRNAEIADKIGIAEALALVHSQGTE